MDGLTLPSMAYRARTGARKGLPYILKTGRFSAARAFTFPPNFINISSV